MRSSDKQRISDGGIDLKTYYNRIPTTDILGQKVKINDKAILFSEHGIAYEGMIKQIGGKRWFSVNEGFRIGGIGNHLMIKC